MYKINASYILQMNSVATVASPLCKVIQNVALFYTFSIILTNISNNFNPPPTGESL